MIYEIDMLGNICMRCLFEENMYEKEMLKVGIYRWCGLILYYKEREIEDELRNMYDCFGV